MRKREALRSGVYSEIHALILGGHFGPEDRLRDTELANELGVSRTPVREALLRLEREGLVRNVVGRGFRVTALSLADAREIYTILWTLEGLAVRLSPRLTRAERAALDEIASQMQSAGDPVRRVDLDNEWHHRLITRCGQRRLIQLIEEAKGSILRYELRYMCLPDLVKVSVRDHHRIASAAMRDPAAAARHLETHWRVALDALEKRMTEQ